MPRYDYQCAACGRRFEVVHGLHDDGPTACPLCGAGPVRKAFAAPAVHFKGSGWAKKERRATPAPASSGDGSAAPATVGATSTSEPKPSGDGDTSSGPKDAGSSDGAGGD